MLKIKFKVSVEQNCGRVGSRRAGMESKEVGRKKNAEIMQNYTWLSICNKLQWRETTLVRGLLAFSEFV